MSHKDSLVVLESGVSREEERRPPASHKDSLVVLEAGVVEGEVKATSES